MIALVLVIGIAVALSVAGWVSLVRGALAPVAPQAAAAPARGLDQDPAAEAVAV